MSENLEAVLALLLAVLPGALVVWGFERISGRWAIGVTDRLLRFFGISAVLHALAAPATYTIWRDYVRPHDAKPLPWWLWGVALLYVVVPLFGGSVLAWRVDRGGRWATKIVGTSTPPSAWDFVFNDKRNAWVRLKLKSGTWIGGAYVEGSHAAGYPEQPDLYLKVAVDVDADTGEFGRDKDGNAITNPYGVLVRWDEVEFLEFAPREGGPEK